MLWADLAAGKDDPVPHIKDTAHSSERRPDIILETATVIHVIELTCAWDGGSGLDFAHVRKTTKYKSIPAEIKVNTRKECRLLCVEVGTRGLLARSFSELAALLPRPRRKDFRNRITQTVIRCSHEIFKNRDNPHWDLSERDAFFEEPAPPDSDTD